MALKKQTIWLLTMLTVMVVLSAYYLIYGPADKINLADPDYEQSATNNEYSPMDIFADVDFDFDLNTVTSLSTADQFAMLRMERAISRDQMIEQYSTAMIKSDDANVIAEASSMIDNLQMIESDELVLESLIKAEGYTDAVVFANGSDINVFIQSDQLAKEEVVNIINLVTNKLNVPGVMVSVKNQP